MNNQATAFSVSEGGFPVRLHLGGGEGAAPHRRSEITLIAVYGGTLRIQLPDETAELTRGQGILINPEVPHSLISAGDECLAPCITFPEEFIAAAGSDIALKYVKPLIESGAPYLPLDSAVQWQRRILELAGGVIALLNSLDPKNAERDGEQSPCPELDIHCRICELWRTLYIGLGADTGAYVSGGEAVSRKRVRLMIDHIRRNYRAQISLAELAASANISKSEASRCFQSCLHVSPMSYLLHYRVETAAQLLRDSAMTIEEISFECGFGSASYFCKIFRRCMGVTPGEFRRKHGRDGG